MRKLRYILPIIIALLCVLFIFITAQRSKSQIIRMIDDAGSKGEPIVICNLNTYRGNSFILTFNHEPVYLITQSITRSGMMPFISDSGEITFIETMHLLRNPTTTTIRKFILPNIFIEETKLIKTPPELGNFETLSVTKDTKNVVCDDERYSIIDLPEFNFSMGLYKSEPPWLNEGNNKPYASVISSDGIIIISRIYSEAASSFELWSYNTGTGEWRKIIADLGACLFSVNPDGSIIGLELADTSPPKTQFINVSDGSVFHEVFQAGDAIIGDRWIALREANGQRIILIDMQNNWEERRIALPANATYDYTIWIPPPGGYDEMMEIREAERNSAESQ
jgi:hypothetical protein